MALRIKGAAQMRRNLRALGSAGTLQKAIAGSLFRSGERIITRSKPLVPVDTGALRSSGGVDVPEIQRNRVEVTLGYGGPAAGYAVHVHERLDVRHPVGQAKYLEQPFLEEAPGVQRRLVDDIRAAIRKTARRRVRR